MNLVTTIVVNIALAGGVIVGLVWLLAHQGIWRGKHHDRRAIMRVRAMQRMGARRGLSSTHA